MSARPTEPGPGPDEGAGLPAPVAASLPPAVGAGPRAAIPDAPDAPLELSLRRLTLAAAAAFTLMFGVFGGWASFAEISGAVVAEGHLVAESTSKPVKHRLGGIVAEVLVRDGDTVAAGDVLVRLDGSQAAAELGIVETRLVNGLARLARLTAEADGGAMSPPADWHGLEGHVEARAVLGQERALLEAIRARRASERSRLVQRRAQLAEEMRGHQSRKTAAETRLEITRGQLSGMVQASAEGFIARVRVQDLQGQVAELVGEIGMNEASIASVREQILLAEHDTLLLDETARAEALEAKGELQGRILELLDQRRAAADTLARSQVRAPAAGIVRALAVHAAGAVLGAGEPMMSIVPDGDRLLVEARLRPVDIDQVKLGQTAEVGFPGLDMRTVDRLLGEVVHVDADLTEAEGPVPAYYLVRVGIDPAAAAEALAALMPGMPAELFLRTNERSPLSYVMRPVLDQFARALREG